MTNDPPEPFLAPGGGRPPDSARRIPRTGRRRPTRANTAKALPDEPPPVRILHELTGGAGVGIGQPVLRATNSLLLAIGGAAPNRSRSQQCAGTSMLASTGPPAGWTSSGASGAVTLQAGAGCARPCCLSDARPGPAPPPTKQVPIAAPSGDPGPTRSEPQTPLVILPPQGRAVQFIWDQPELGTPVSIEPLHLWLSWPGWSALRFATSAVPSLRGSAPVAPLPAFNPSAKRTDW